MNIVEHYDNLKNTHKDWVLMGQVGSQNYGTATPNSDIDIKVAYLPRFEEFFYGKFYHYDNSGPENIVDHTVHPIHEFMSHAFKGNINFFEVFFSNQTIYNIGDRETTEQFIRNCQSGVLYNWINNYNAMKGMAVQKKIKAMKTTHPEIFWKEAQHAMRMLDTILHYYNRGTMSLDRVTFEAPIWKDWRSRTDIDYYGVTNLFEEKLTTVDNLRQQFEERHIWATKVRTNVQSAAYNTIIKLVKDEG